MNTGISLISSIFKLFAAILNNKLNTILQRQAYSKKRTIRICAGKSYVGFPCYHSQRDTGQLS